MQPHQSHWRKLLAPIITQVIEANQERPESEVRNALRDAWPRELGPRTNHPYQIWLDEIARQLGHKPRPRRWQRHATAAPDPRQQGLF